MDSLGGMTGDKKSPAYGGRVLTYVRRGKVVVAKWPRKRGTPKHPKTRAQNAWFRVANKIAKYVHPAEQEVALEATAHTPLLPRDIQLMAMAGRLVAFNFGNGRKLWSMAARQEVSESLDVIAPLPGGLLYRAARFWEALAPGKAGEVLISQGADAPPVWGTGGGGAGGGGALTDALLDAEQTGFNIHWPAAAEEILVILDGIIDPTGNTFPRARVSQDSFATVESQADGYKDGTSASTNRMAMTNSVLGAGRHYSAQALFWRDSVNGGFGMTGSSFGVLADGKVANVSIGGTGNALRDIVPNGLRIETERAGGAAQLRCRFLPYIL